MTRAPPATTAAPPRPTMATRRPCILLTLVRCGDTDWDTDRRVHGSTDLPLSDDGRSAFAAAAKAFPGRPDWIHHPPDEAAVDTARLLAEHCGGRGRETPELAEPDLGLLEGLTEAVFAERYPKRYKQWQNDPVTLSPPEGEDLADARVRVLAAVARILRRGKAEEVALVLHPLALGFVRCWLADRRSGDLWTLVRDRPRLERYVLTEPMIGWLEEAAATVGAEA